MKFTRITHNTAVMGGKPCIRGLRVTVGTVVGLLASGESRRSGRARSRALRAAQGATPMGGAKAFGPDPAPRELQKFSWLADRVPK